MRLVAPIDVVARSADIDDEQSLVHRLAGWDHLEIGLGGRLSIVLDDRGEQEDQRFAHRLVELARVPEIDEAEPPVRQDEDVAGMRVSVEDPFYEDGVP